MISLSSDGFRQGNLSKSCYIYINAYVDVFWRGQLGTILGTMNDRSCLRGNAIPENNEGSPPLPYGERFVAARP